MNNNIRAITLILFFVLAILLVIVGVGFGVSAWLQANYGASAVLLVWFTVMLIVGVFAGWGMSLRTQRTTLNAIVEFQAADDRGEVARARVLQDIVKASIWGEQRRYSESHTTPLLPVQQQQALAVDWTKAALPADTEWVVIE